MYHDRPQPFRIQKRLVLNQCFKTIQQDSGLPARVAYVTFGGADLYDAMDLVAVFSVRNHQLTIVSYERDEDIARASRECYVASTLSRIDTVDIRIVATEFPEHIDTLYDLRDDNRFVYFLDYTQTFKDGEASDIAELLEAGVLQEEDYLLVTSCLSPRIVHDPRFMEKHRRSFQLFFKTTRIDKAFKVRNHVDLLIAIEFSRFEKKSIALGMDRPLAVKLLGKYKYRDTQAAMGLWLYRIVGKESGQLLRDVQFDEFPHAFTRSEPQDIPNIFD